MSYDYQKQRKEIFTEYGVQLLTQMRDNVHKLLNNSGAFTVDKVIYGLTGDSWTMLAVLDYLEEQGEIVKVSNKGYAQYHVYTKTNW